MEYIALALENKHSHLVKKARLKISEWLDYKKMGSHGIVTVYLEFSDSDKLQDLDHIYIVVSRNDLERITLPALEEIVEENGSLENRELSQRIDIKSRFISPIQVKAISKDKKSKEHALIKIDLKKFEIDENGTNRFQFRFFIQDSFRKNSWRSAFSGEPWDWSYEAPINPLVIDKDEFTEIAQIKMDLEVWVMVEDSMYDSVSDLNIRSSLAFDRFVILQEETSKRYRRGFVRPNTLCVRWFFPEFSESGLGAEIIINKKKSTRQREKNFVKKINENPKYFFSTVNEILNSSRITCVDFHYISERLEEKEFAEYLNILFQLLYHKDDHALSRLEEFVSILEDLQKLKYGRYYYLMFKLLDQMRTRDEIPDIFMPRARKLLSEFLDVPEFMSKAVIDLFEDLKGLIDLIEQYHYYSNPEDKYKQKQEILEKIKLLRDNTEHKLINPENYLISEEILLKWERLVKKDFERFVGCPRLNVELKTKRLLKSDFIHLIFDITNISDVPLVILEAELLPSEQYEIVEHEKTETTKRKQLTKSDRKNERIFTPEFAVNPITFPEVHIKLKVKAFTEEGKRFSDIFDMRIELFEADAPFKKVEESPYIVGNPVKKRDMFYGRNDVFEKIRGTIVGQSVNQAIIHGPYRIGKTSILYQLMNELKGKYVPVLAITHELETGDSELLRFWSKQIALAVKDRVQKAPEIPGYEKASDPYKEFQEFTDGIMKELEDAKVIFMVDEYDMIDDLIKSKEISEEFFRILDWMIKHNRIELILAGRSSMDILKVEKWKEIAPPFAQIELGTLEREDAKRLIEEPIKDYFKYDDSAIEKIIRLTGCHPYLIQLCCSVLVNYHNSEGRSVLKYNDVEKCIPEILVTGEYGLEAMILKDTTREEKIVMRVMAVVLEKQTSISEQELVVRIRGYNPYIEDRDIKDAISHLEKKRIIRSTTEKIKNFKFVCELFKHRIPEEMEPMENQIL